ncbi:hypothetical protein ABZ918_10485 [Streptomyces viridosporus]|uniref:hypothetical protein n=1 Tax=Streptomyces viridosporus TaxID=67581 RepID=UPI00343DA27E
MLHHPAAPGHDSDPQSWHDLFNVIIDTDVIACVRPIDTDRPTWVVYLPGRHPPGDYLGTVHARNTDGRWHIQSTGEHHGCFTEALRSLHRTRIPTAPARQEDAARG